MSIDFITRMMRRFFFPVLFHNKNVKLTIICIMANFLLSYFMCFATILLLFHNVW